MTNRVGIKGPPNSYIEGDWPYGTPTITEAAYAQHIARALTDTIGNASLRSVATKCGVHHTTLSAIVTGDRWVELVTLARLEQGLGTSLWPTP